MKKALVFALSALALLSCTREAAPIQHESTGTEVRFKANIPNTFEFKSTTALEGKTVRIVAGAPINATTTAVAAGEALTPADIIRWNLNQTEKTTFAAIYGGENVPGAPENMEVPYSVVNGGNHDVAYHSAYLLAVAQDVTPGTEVELNFAHPFAKMAIAVTNQIEGYDVKSVVVKDVITEGTFKLTDGSVELGTAKDDIVTSIVDNKYTAIIFPQEVKLAIYITLGKEGAEDQVYAFALKEAKTFVANKAYNAAITLTPATPTVGDPVSFGFEVADWAAGDNLETEGIEIPAEPEDVWTVIGLGGDWDTDVAMTKNTNGEWEADITYAAGDEFKLRANGGWNKSAGMKTGWTVFALGEFDDNYLAENSDNNIKLAAAGAYHLVFNPTNYHFVVTENNTNPPAPTTVTLTVNVYNESGWENLKFWAWQGTTNLCVEAWPGQAPAAQDVVVNNNHFKSFAVEATPGEAIGYLLNNGNGEQTSDQSVDAISADATVYVWLKANKIVEVIADPATFNPAAAPADPVLTLNVYNNTNWGDEIKLYAWSEAGTLTNAWPGNAPAAEDVVAGNNHFKSFTLSIPSGVAFQYILNGGGNQTADLNNITAITADTTVYVELTMNGTTIIADPANFVPSN